jgi:hypothetical protein
LKPSRASGVDPDVERALERHGRAPTRSAVPAPVIPIQRPRAPRRDHGVSAEYPDWFATGYLRAVLSGDTVGAGAYYTERTFTVPDDAEGWLGCAAVALVEGRVVDAAAHLVKGYELASTFPIGRLLNDVRGEAPEVWYDLVGQMVSLRRKRAYECADIILAECLASRRATEGLKLRCGKVRERIRKALRERVQRDQRRGVLGPLMVRRAMIQSAIVLAILLALLGLVSLLKGRPHPAAQTAPLIQVEPGTTTPPSTEDAGSADVGSQPVSHAAGSSQGAGSTQAAGSTQESSQGAASTQAAASSQGSSQGAGSSQVAGSSQGSSQAAASSQGSSQAAASSQGSSQAAGSAQGAAGPPPVAPLAASPTRDTLWASAWHEPSPAARLWIVAQKPPVAPSTDAYLFISDDRGNGHMVSMNGHAVGTTPTLIVTGGGRRCALKVGDWSGVVTPGPGEQRRITASLHRSAPPGN